MIAVLGGCGAAACWAGAALTASRASRLLGAWSSLAWVMLTGFVVVGPPTLAVGIPDDFGARELGWLLTSGFGNVCGLLFSYAALRRGKVALVTPIISTEGAITAAIAIAAGESVGVGVGVMLVVVAIGVVLASAQPGGPAPDHPVEASVLGGVAALCFGVSLYATGRLGGTLPLVWAIVPARLVGTLFVVLPLAASKRLTLTRRAAPFVFVSGLCEVAGAALFVLGSRHSISVTAVLGSQFATLAAIVAFILFRERLTRVQVAGIAVIAVGVAALSALQA